MAESDRGIHPDLLEETLEERADETAAAPPEAQPAAGRSRRRASARANGATPPPSGGSDDGGVPADPGASPDSGEAEVADWRQSWSSAATPEEAFALLAKNLPSEVISKDETLSGFIGSRADQRARDLLRQQQRDEEERRKREAAANNDLYTLGELTQREYQQQIQQSSQVEQLQPLMDVITRFQQTLPEPIQREVAGKTFGEGRPWNEGLQEYLSYLVDSATKLRLSERESALRKSILSEVNGSEPVPEREGGTPSRVRVVTDEQVAAMSLREYDALFDENGHPRPGVQHRPTRGIPIQRT
jgi:hypothetical protein